MKFLKNIFVGFLVSFLGSIPLGYLNVIGFEVYEKNGMSSLFYYLLGVMIVEGIVIYSTLVFATKLSKKKKLMKFIELFSIIFMLFLAWYFHHASGGEDGDKENHIAKYAGTSSFLLGLMFSCFNFMQIPFWTGWNIYVVNQNYVSSEKKYRLPYLGGTLCGTFAGMLVFVLLLSLVTSNADGLSSYVMPVIIPLVFLGMAIYQAIKFYIKYYRKK